MAMSELSARYRPPTDKKYIFFASIAAVLLAMSQIIRGVASYDLFSTKFTLSVNYLVLSSIYFLVRKIIAINRNEVFYAPWYTA